MKHHIAATFSILAFSTASSAAIPLRPAQILCTQHEHSQVGIEFGIEKIDIRGSEAHLFEYGGKVTVTKDGDKERYPYVKEQYSYVYGRGQDFYTMKEKTPYSKDFVDRHTLFLVVDPGWGDSSGFLILKAHMLGSIFHIDFTKRRYYGYVPDFGAVNAYAGTCTILKK